MARKSQAAVAVLEEIDEVNVIEPEAQGELPEEEFTGDVQTDNTENTPPAKDNPNDVAEGYVKKADEEFFRAMRDGKYEEIVNSIGDLNYSVRNVMLIKSQYPQAKNVKGMNAWNYNRRSVKKDSKSIKILAPKITNIKGGEENAEKPKAAYKINYVFDISQTQGEDIRETRCDKDFIETHYDGIKNSIALAARGYTFKYDEPYSSVDYGKKEVGIKAGLSKEDTLKAMIRHVACIRIEGKDREEGNDISQGKEMFNGIKASAATRMVARRIGLGDTKLKTIDFTEFDDEALNRVAADLNFSRSVADRIAAQVEDFVLENREEQETETDNIGDTYDVGEEETNMTYVYDEEM